MLVWTNSTECDAEQTAALLGLVLDIDIATPILTVFVSARGLLAALGCLSAAGLHASSTAGPASACPPASLLPRLYR